MVNPVKVDETNLSIQKDVGRMMDDMNCMANSEVQNPKDRSSSLSVNALQDKIEQDRLKHLEKIYGTE